MKKIALLGSTGSIGVQTLNVVRHHPELFKIVSLSGGSNISLLSQQIKEFSPKVATANIPLEKQNGVEYFFGEKSFVNAIIDDADIVVIALSGFSGIYAVLNAIKKGKNIALANKESLVLGGELVVPLAKERGISICPIDSEHSAIFQALSFDFNKPFKKIILTCSGGAFRDLDVQQLKNVKANDALKHPNWNMGKRITIDCSTLLNKAYEVAEAKWLYNTQFDKITAIIHRESIVHSMVEFEDNSVIAQMSYPSMELPIALALSYPNRITSQVNSLDFAELKSLTFSEIDNARFPLFSFGVEVAKKGGLYPTVMNGADEMAVKLFLDNKISFCDIYNCIYGAVSSFAGGKVSMEGIEEADRFARDYVKRNFGE